jgi:integrase/recombinase XerC
LVGNARGPLIHLVPRSSLEEDVGDFLLDRRARNLSPRTVEFYANELRYLTQYLAAAGATETAAVTPAHIRGYLLELSSRRNAGGVAAAFRALRAFFTWWKVETDAPVSPITKVSPPRVPRQPLQPVPIASIVAMVGTCRPKTLAGDRDRALLLFLLDSGLRASEVAGLTVGDIDTQYGAVTVRSGKGGKRRTAYVGAKTLRELRRYLKHRDTVATDPLFAALDGAPLDRYGLRGILRRRAKRAGVPAPPLHSFRRAFALASLRGGMDIYSLQKLMGHASLTVLRQYLAQTEDDLQDAHRRAGPVDHLL